MKKIFQFIIFSVVLALPALAAAQVLPVLSPQPNLDYVDSWVITIMRYANMAITFLMVVATGFFLWSVIRYIMDKGDDSKATGAKKKAMINGIIGLAVMVGIWGIIRILTNTFGVSVGGTAPVACPPGLQYNQMNRTCQ